MQITSLVIHHSLLPRLHEACKLGPGGDDGNTLKFILDMKKVVVLADDPVLDEVQGYLTVESLVRFGETLSERPRRLRGGERLCYLFQSSGTSGLPKAMMISHKNAIHSGLQGMITAVQSARYAGVEPCQAQRLLGVVPAYHSYGMILWILRVNLTPATNIMLPKWDLELALKTIEKYKITLLPLVPPLVRQLAQSPLTEKYDLSSVVTAASGAAYLPPDVAYQLAKKLPQGTVAPIPSGYGLSEAASIASPTAPGMFALEEAKPGTIGYLLPGMKGRVVDPETLKDVPKGQKGELWAQGNVVTPGYFHDPKATTEIFAEPDWLRTGDLVMRDEHDRIWYLDRLKEMIKVKGLQVAATEVEDTLLAYPDGLVRDACVAGVDNGRGDGSLFVRAWVVLTAEGQKLDESTLQSKLNEWIEGRLSRHKWLTGGIEVVDGVSGLEGPKCEVATLLTLRSDTQDPFGQDVAERDERPVSGTFEAARKAGKTLVLRCLCWLPLRCPAARQFWSASLGCAVAIQSSAHKYHQNGYICYTRAKDFRPTSIRENAQCKDSRIACDDSKSLLVISNIVQIEDRAKEEENSKDDVEDDYECVQPSLEEVHERHFGVWLVFQSVTGQYQYE